MTKSESKEQRPTWLLFSYVLFLICLTLYSYSLIDPNLTLINNKTWEAFRNAAVQFGYLNRHDAWLTYLVLVILSFMFHHTIQKYSFINPVYLACITAGIALFAYPFASHDIFNYIFDAHIFTHYGLNPYTHIAGNFIDDPWLRFMHWTHRPYPYGPTFLPLTLVVSFLAANKLILNFLFFKAMASCAYVGSVWHLAKMNKKWALFFATHPLILIEGLINAHNDLIAVYFAIAGIALLTQSQSTSRAILSRLLLLISGGIKFFTLPAILLQKPQRTSQTIGTWIAYIGILTLILYVSLTHSIQPWYLLNIFLFIPYFKNHIEITSLWMFGLLISYYPFIRLGSWDAVNGIDLRMAIIIVSGVANIVWILYTRWQLSPAQIVKDKMNLRT